MENKQINIAIIIAIAVVVFLVMAITMIAQTVCLKKVSEELGAGTRIEATATQTINLYYNGSQYHPKRAEIKDNIVRWENGNTIMVGSLDQVVIFIGEIK